MALVLVNGAFSATAGQLAAATEHRTTLAATLTAGGTSMTLAAALASVTGETYIRIDNEVIKVTAGLNTTTPTIQRGREGTTAVEHVSGAKVFAVLTKEALETYVTENSGSGNVILRGTWAEQQAYSTASLTAGDMWIFTDAYTIDRARWDGSAWQYFDGGVNVQPMLSSDWTTFLTPGGGSINRAFDRGAWKMDINNVGTGDIFGITRSLSSVVGSDTNWELEINVESAYGKQFGNKQLGALLTASTSIYQGLPRYAQTGFDGFFMDGEYQKGYSATYTATGEDSGVIGTGPQSNFFRVFRNGATRGAYSSIDGVNFVRTRNDVAWTWGFTPINWGFGGFHGGSAGDKPLYLTVGWWRRVA